VSQMPADRPCRNAANEGKGEQGCDQRAVTSGGMVVRRYRHEDTGAKSKCNERDPLRGRLRSTVTTVPWAPRTTRPR
jgi:hypothetical protein